MKRVLLVVFLLLTLAPVLASISESDLGEFEGYTILGTKTITGWRDTDGSNKGGDSFEGCQYGRVIIFDSRAILKCTEYSYSYSYRPTALILVKGSSFVMVVDGNKYRMSN